MRALEFETLAQSQTVRAALSAFGTLVGLPVMIIPTDEPPCHNSSDGPANPFCRLLTRSPVGQSRCDEFVRRLQSRLEKESSACSLRCFAGLTRLAAPVIVGQHPVAALVSEGFLLERPREKGFEICWRRLRQAAPQIDRSWARKEYRQIAIAPAARVRAARRLLVVLAQHLGDMAAHCLPARRDDDPPCVACAKRFVEKHLDQMPRTQGIADAVHVTEPYFCRMFKAATGMTFSEYVARSHVERAKQLLSEQSSRVTEVAFAAGFRSIPHFNHTFKRYSGMSPTEYRATLLREARRDLHSNS